MLHRLNHIPDGLLDRNADQLFEVLTGPVLIELEGERNPPLFVSILLHGNETSGWEIIKNILEKYKDQKLPRSLILFIGNTEAASQNKRHLDTQPDYNRIWVAGDTAEHKMINQLMDEMSKRPLFASIDIHNNTGINPHYACINRLDYKFINLAKKFSRTVIYFIRPNGVQSKVFAKFCPSVTLECGQSDDEYGIQLGTNFVDAILNSDELSDAPVEDNEIDLFHTLAIIKVNQEVSISFDEEEADIRFIKGIETLNFEEIPAETKLATLKHEIQDSLHVLNEEGEDIANKLFALTDNKLITRKPLMPAMLTTNEKVIRQDCLCYVMERYKITMGEKNIPDDKQLWGN